MTAPYQQLYLGLAQIRRILRFPIYFRPVIFLSDPPASSQAAQVASQAQRCTLGSTPGKLYSQQVFLASMTSCSHFHSCHTA